ncbi:MAG: hypothetical protein L3J75_15010 [Methylococcaceae bacterium]|nr:hypothetical protein [Methylococcaceae bacterium]
MVADDGLPNNTLTYQWTKDSGLGAVSFNTPNAPETKVTFTKAGRYLLKLTANDGALSGSAIIRVIVDPFEDQHPPVVDNPAPSGTFIDDFAGTLKSGWKWISEKPDDWRIRTNGLEIKSSESTTIYKHRDREESHNTLVRPININKSVDFAVSTQINTNSGGQGGLILYQDNDNYIKLVIEKLRPYDPKEPFFVMLREQNGAVNHFHKEDKDIKGGEGSQKDVKNNDEIKVRIPGNKNREEFIYDLRLRLHNKRVTMYWRVPGGSWNRIQESMPLPESSGQWFAGIYSSGKSAENGQGWQRYRNFKLTVFED